MFSHKAFSTAEFKFKDTRLLRKCVSNPPTASGRESKMLRVILK